MRDVSEGGALLEVSEPQWLPSRFHLIVEADGLEVDCEIMHRAEDSVGVRFTVPVKL